MSYYDEVCECCGHEFGTCSVCGSRHVPAVPDGCEECSLELRSERGELTFLYSEESDDGEAE